MLVQDRWHALPLFSRKTSFRNKKEREKIEVARGWLRSCLSGHEACRKRQVESQASHSGEHSEMTMPSLLIKIDVDWSSDVIKSIHIISC
jgi:hypothetical protein